MAERLNTRSAHERKKIRTMRQHRKENDLRLGLRFIEEGEIRVLQQRQLIARLKKKGQSTDQAEAALKGFERSLLQLRNHLEIMQELMKPDQY